MNEQRNVMLAIALSVVVLVASQYLLPRPDAPREQDISGPVAGELAPGADTGMSDDLAPPEGPETLTPGTPAPETSAGQSAGSQEAVEQPAGRVRIITPQLEGSLNLRGAVLDDLLLLNYQTEQGGQGEPVRLLAPRNSRFAYLARFGWTAQSGLPAAPAPDAVWEASGTELTPGSPVILSYANDEGILFEQEISVDETFMFTVEQRVINPLDVSYTVAPYGLLSQRPRPSEDLFILDIGPLGVFSGSYKNISYSDVADEGFTEVTSADWLGFTEKYWMTAMIPDQEQPLGRARFRADTSASGTYVADFVQNWQVVPPSGEVSTTSRLFAGAKIVSSIDAYAEQYQIPLFDRAIDWGWFPFLTRPIFWGLDTLFTLLGNFGLAILLLTVIVKLILLPLANKSYVSMARMKSVQPKMKALQERFKDDRQRLQQEMMQLYQKEKINPLAGCLPILVQIPVFFALYKVLYVTIEMRHQPFYGWITDLSAPDPLTPFNLFGLIPWDLPAFLAVGLWPIFMGVSMWLQQKMNPTAMDPTQQKIMAFLPFIFVFIMANFAAGLVIYWTWNSFLSIAQQWAITRRFEAKQA